MASDQQAQLDEEMTAEFGHATPVLAQGFEAATAKGDAPGATGLPEPLSQDTQKLLARAHEQARQLGHVEIHPEHLLLALLLLNGDRATRTMLRVAGGNRDELVALREGLLGRLKRLPTGTEADIALSDGCKQVLQAAVAEATRLGRPSNVRVEPLHLLFGLISEGSAFLGSRLTTTLALRGLRMAVGTGVLRPGRNPIPNEGYLAVAPGMPPPPQRSESRAVPATRDNVITFRVTDAELAAVDTLVETGAMRTRSEASGWLLQSGIAANSAYFDEINRIGEEIARLRAEVQELTAARFGGETAAGDPSSQPTGDVDSA